MQKAVLLLNYVVLSKDQSEVTQQIRDVVAHLYSQFVT